MHYMIGKTACVMYALIMIAGPAFAQDHTCSNDSLTTTVLVYFYGDGIEDEDIVTLDVVGESIPVPAVRTYAVKTDNKEYPVVWVAKLSAPQKISDLKITPQKKGYISYKPDLVDAVSSEGECLAYIRFKLDRAWSAYVKTEPAQVPVPIRFAPIFEEFNNAPATSPQLHWEDTLIIGVKCMGDSIIEFEITSRELKDDDEIYDRNEIRRIIAEDIFKITNNESMDFALQIIDRILSINTVIIKWEDK